MSPNVNDFFPSKYLKAADLQGAEPVVTIDRVDFEPVGRDREMKAVLYFVGKAKGLILNKTNCNKIVELIGSAITEEWAGSKLKLYATETQFGGDTVDCIRIKPVAPAKMQRMTKPAPPPVERDDDHELSDDEIPFAWLVPFIMPALGLLGVVLA
jgi:hypothetical protein